MNIRMQVTIPERDHARVSERASERGISIAEYLRRLVRQDLDDDPAPAVLDVTELFGIGDSGGSDVATRKHQYLAGAIGADKSDLAAGA